MQDFFHQQYYLTCWWLFVNRNLLLNPINNKTSKPQCIKPIPRKDYFPVKCGHPFFVYEIKCNFQPRFYRGVPGIHTHTHMYPTLYPKIAIDGPWTTSFGWFYPARPSWCCWPVASYAPKCWSRGICVMAQKGQHKFEPVDFSMFSWLNQKVASLYIHIVRGWYLRHFR